MALNREDYNRIAAHFAEETTEAGREHFDHWQQNLPDDADLRELQTIWENSGARATDTEVDSDAEWTKLKQAIRLDDEKNNVAPGVQVPMWLRIAATLLIVALAGVWFLRETPSPIGETRDAYTIVADDGVRTFFLPDSSRIWLNAGSSLSYYDDAFGDTERRVVLKGEGYFNVSSDRSRPFIVQTETALVRVVGTSFNVRADKDSVYLDVEEGRVRFSPSDSTGHGSVLITAGESARVGNNNQVSKAQATERGSGRWRLKNNPLYELEKKSPARFIHPKFEWRKNSINQTVIKGRLSSNAELAVYKNIVLRIAYENAKGRAMESQLQIAGPITPGDSMDFEKRLFDIFRDTRSLEISVTSAEIIEDQK